MQSDPEFFQDVASGCDSLRRRVKDRRLADRPMSVLLVMQMDQLESALQTAERLALGLGSMASAFEPKEPQ